MQSMGRDRKRQIDGQRRISDTTGRDVAKVRASVDPRVIRTRTVLRESLLALLKEQDYEQITVRDICARAHINRGTFYRHYNDKDQLLGETATDTLDAVAAMDSPPSEGTTPAALVAWFEHAAEHAELYHLLLGRDGMIVFSKRVQTHIERLMAELFTGRDNEVPPDVTIRFLSSACLGVLSWWLERRMPCSADEAATWLWRICRSTDPLIPDIDDV